MGWVDYHKAEEGESVRGLIIARSFSKKLLYALHSIASATDLDIGLKRYTADEFKLENVNPTQEIVMKGMTPEQAKQRLEMLKERGHSEMLKEQGYDVVLCQA